MKKIFTLKTCLFFIGLFMIGIPLADAQESVSASDNVEQCVVNFGDLVTFDLVVTPVDAGNTAVVAGSIDVSFEAYHSWASDVEIEICAPGGGVCAIIKSDGTGGSGDIGNAGGSDYDGVYDISDGAGGGTTMDPAGTAAIPPGSYDPVDAFSIFDGVDGVGTWTITLADDANGDDGCLQNVTLDLDLEPGSTIPGCATIDSPSDGSSIGNECGGDVTLSWTASGAGPAADSYDVYFGATSGALTLETNTTSTSYTKTGTSANTTYYWRIVPKAGAVEATGCSEWSFMTGASVDSGAGDETYTFNNSTVPGGPVYSWIDPVAGGHTEITSWTAGSDDDGYFYIADMGITFNYNGGDGYMDCNIGTNGYVSLGATGYTSTGGSTTIPSTSDPDNMIAACMMDLDDRSDGQIFYATVGNSFVITWWHYHDYNDDTEWISVQLVMEGDGDGGFNIYYNQDESSVGMPDILSDAVIGAEFGDTDGVIYRSNGVGGPIFCSPLAIAFEHSLALPVELSFFTGEVMDKSNMLSWETASEENTEMHVVERSVNGRDNWEEIGQVAAFGNSFTAQNYKLEDMNPVAKAYYRLKSVDFDGYTGYSEVISLERKIETFEVIALAPNPARSTINLDFQTPKNGAYTIRVSNMIGQILSAEQLNLDAGIHSHAIDVSAFSNGVYFITIENGFESLVHKIVKQ